MRTKSHQGGYWTCVKVKMPRNVLVNHQLFDRIESFICKFWWQLCALNQVLTHFAEFQFWRFIKNRTTWEFGFKHYQKFQRAFHYHLTSWVRTTLRYTLAELKKLSLFEALTLPVLCNIQFCSNTNINWSVWFMNIFLSEVSSYNCFKVASILQMLQQRK